MLKIAKVIKTCNECEFCTVAKSVSDNYTNFAICSSPNVSVFVIATRTDSVKNYDMLIPDNCPLEDYKETEK